MRNLAIVLGDQLDRESAVFDDFEPEKDVVWMAEVAEEATYVPAHRRRLVLFFAAMRHFRDSLRREGIRVQYQALSMDPACDRGTDFAEVLREDVPALQPATMVVVEPGDWRVREALRRCADELRVPLEIRRDRHFYCGIDEFRDWARQRRSLLLEDFYRRMRRRHQVLMDDGGPAGGVWNLDRDNRSSFGRHGPDGVPPPERFPPNPVTNAVIETVRARFPDHPGRLEDFDLPVTRGQARRALDEFIEHRLPGFGTWQDAMWNGESLLHHSRLSAPLNLHLLRPRECVDAAEQAYRSGRAALNDVEGFIRQILGWREFVRGVYWAHMPEYANGNALDHHEALPDFYWSGATDMACFADAMTNVLDHGYAHHIQRLMVLGLFALLYGVEPYRFHEWHMAMYVDAVDWVSLPNTLGMSQFGDGGVVGTKPYCASGAYIKRMSNYCSSCRYDPGAATGASACPFTTLYWDFLDRHAQRFAGNRRMTFQLRNLDRRRQRPGEMESIRAQARRLRESHNDGH